METRPEIVIVALAHVAIATGIRGDVSGHGNGQENRRMMFGGVGQGGQDGPAGACASAEEMIVLEMEVAAGIGGVVGPVIGGPAIAAHTEERACAIVRVEKVIDAIDIGAYGPGGALEI